MSWLSATATSAPMRTHTDAATPVRLRSRRASHHPATKNKANSTTPYTAKSAMNPCSQPVRRAKSWMTWKSPTSPAGPGEPVGVTALVTSPVGEIRTKACRRDTGSPPTGRYDPIRPPSAASLISTLRQVSADQIVHLAIGVVALLALTYAVIRFGDLPLRFEPAIAVARGTAQLALVGLALRGVLSA